METSASGLVTPVSGSRRRSGEQGRGAERFSGLATGRLRVPCFNRPAGMVAAADLWSDGRLLRDNLDIDCQHAR